jgi:hypothetical protein
MQLSCFAPPCRAGSAEVSQTPERLRARSAPDPSPLRPRCQRQRRAGRAAAVSHWSWLRSRANSNSICLHSATGSCRGFATLPS